MPVTIPALESRFRPQGAAPEPLVLALAPKIQKILDAMCNSGDLVLGDWPHAGIADITVALRHFFGSGHQSAANKTVRVIASGRAPIRIDRHPSLGFEGDYWIPFLERLHRGNQSPFGELKTEFWVPFLERLLDLWRPLQSPHRPQATAPPNAATT